MKSIRMAIWLAILVLMVPWVAMAQSIYSWTDENGVKHFSDRAPPANVEASQELIPKTETVPFDDAEDPADTVIDEPINEEADNTTAEADLGTAPAELSYADQQRQAIAERREAEREKRAERDKLCLQARDELARIEPNRRVFSTDEDGNTTRLDDEERVRMVEERKSQIASFCD